MYCHPEIKNIKSENKKPKKLQSQLVQQCEKLKLLENTRNKRYMELRLENVCLADNQGLVKGLCLHNNKPLSSFITCLPPSLRRLEWTNEIVYLMTTYQADLFGYSNVFAGIYFCPKLFKRIKAIISFSNAIYISVELDKNHSALGEGYTL